MKKSFFILLWFLIFLSAAGQEFAIILDSVITNEIDGDYSYYKFVRVERYVNTPSIFQDTSKVSMHYFHHNILIARVKNAILHYDVNTSKLDTLFFVYPETQILKPLWSPNNDKVAFLIYNPQKKYNYTTPYRLIVLTLNNGKVLKKEKINIEKIPGFNYYFEMQDFQQILSGNFLKFVSNNKIEILKTGQVLTFSQTKGYEPVDFSKNFDLLKKKGKYFIIEYKKTNAPGLISLEVYYYYFFYFKNNLLFSYNLDQGLLTVYDAKLDKIVKQFPVKKIYSKFVFSDDGRYVAFVASNSYEGGSAFPVVLDCKTLQMQTYNKPVYLAAADDYVFAGSMHFVNNSGKWKLIIESGEFFTGKTVHYEIDLPK